jgi:hypothetical protein
MKLVDRINDSLVFRLSKGEHETLASTLQFRARLPRTARSITGDTPTTAQLREAQADLELAFEEHRRALSDSVTKLLEDAERCVPVEKGAFNLILSRGDFEMLLQALNDVRVGAWEKLGCPDFETGDFPDVNDSNLLAVMVLQLTDAFQGILLSAVSGDL